MKAFLTADQFRAQYAPAFGASWTEAEKKLLSDPHEKAIIDQLTACAIAGLLREPVQVHLGDDIDPQHRVVNGMHRVIACARAGVPIEHTWAPETAPVNGYLDLRIVLPYLDVIKADTLFPALRSFMIDKHWWANTNILSTSNEAGQTIVVCEYAIPDAANVDEFREALISSLRRQLQKMLLPDFTSVSFRHVNDFQ